MIVLCEDSKWVLSPQPFAIDRIDYDHIGFHTGVRSRKNQLVFMKCPAVLKDLNPIP